jgi:arginyl-tRNA synthetase
MPNRCRSVDSAGHEEEHHDDDDDDDDLLLPLLLLLMMMIEAMMIVERSKQLTATLIYCAARVQLWRRFRDLSVEEYRRIYARLGISFDEYSGEALYSDAARDIGRGVWRDARLDLRDDHGAQMLDFPAGPTPAMLARSNGTSTYVARDIAALLERCERLNPTRMLYVVGHEQRLHFQQVFAASARFNDASASPAALAKYIAGCEHVPFGPVRGMSTRRGEVVFLEDILQDAQEKMREWLLAKRPDSSGQCVEDVEETSRVLGLSAVVVQDQSSQRMTGYTFDWERILKASRDTGPLLQFAHARLCGIARHSGLQLSSADVLALPAVAAQHLSEPTAHALITAIAAYPDVVERAAEEREPHIVVQHLFKLMHAATAALHDLRVRGEPDETTRAARAALFLTAQRTLSAGLQLLGLEARERV